jgi:hypothetical protein
MRTVLTRLILFLFTGLFPGQLVHASVPVNPSFGIQNKRFLSENVEALYPDGTVTSFKDSYIISMTPWKIVEASESMPRVLYPAYIGTGRLGVGVDAAGLQSLTDQLRGQRFNLVPPYNVTQSDLYVLHDGIMSEVLIKDEVKLTRTSPDILPYGLTKNFMPFCYLDQTFKYNGKEIRGDAIYPLARQWRREWNLEQGILRTNYVLDEKYNLEVEMFAPYGGETVYCKLTRKTVRRGRVDAGDSSDESFRWEIFLPLKTRNGMSLFDEPGAVKTGKRTVLASVTEKSSYNPSERYGFLYGVAADKAEIVIKPDGLSVIVTNPISENNITYLRFDFHRLAGKDLNKTTSIQNSLEKELSGFNAQGYQEAMEHHIADYASFWAKTADVEVHGGNAFETKRRYMLHMSQYMLRNGNDYSYGGTLQLLFMHNNGWAACNFHDHQYIVDGLARSNMWEETLSNLIWMKKVMRTDGRPFPWMLRYNGEKGAKPERDRAPMSDANRAMLALRIYELGGKGRDTLLKNMVYPIVKAVVEMSLKDWFYEKDGRLIFRGVETDVMGQTPIENDLATVLGYITLIKKVITHSEYLDIDEDRRKEWQDVINRWKPEITTSGWYAPRLGASDKVRAGTWLCISEYLTECQKYLNPDILRAMNDNGQPVVRSNIPWISFAAASSEMRLNRPDRSEQFFIDNINHRIHGPGYFEESLSDGGVPPPYASAHGSHLVAACEQVLMSDFWSHRIEIGTGLPSTLRTQHLKFHSLRGRDGVLVSGESTPKTLEVNLHHTGDPVKMDVVMSIPCQLGPLLRVSLDGQQVAYTFKGEQVIVNVPLEFGKDYKLKIEDGWDIVNSSQYR